ncbi:MAG: ABC transporter permease [Actinomycetota bacterium]|nr:ABC transporter permease [Actinomycetota bacterium]
MNLRRILAILGKDLRDAGRDGRIVALLLLPIGFAVFYNATIDDEDELPITKVAVVEPADRGVARELRQSAGKSVKVEVKQARDATAARKLVAEDEADFAVVVAPARSDGPSRAQVLVSQNASPTAQSVVALVPDALTRASGREPPARTQIRAVPPVDQKPYEIVDQRALTVLIMILLLVAFVAMMVVPIQTAEELETGTFGALRLAATGPEVLAAKAVAGFIYGLAGVALTVAITSLDVHDPLLFFGATLALVVSLVGFGLLMGLLIPNSNAINSYGAFFLMPLLGLAVAVFFVESGVVMTILDLLPFSQAAKLLGDGLSSETPFDTGPASWAVIAVWAVSGYVILARIATRREI